MAKKFYKKYCPFCGSRNIIVTWDRYDEDHCGICEDCGASGPIKRGVKAAAKAWNERATAAMKQEARS